MTDLPKCRFKDFQVRMDADVDRLKQIMNQSRRNVVGAKRGVQVVFDSKPLSNEGRCLTGELD